MASWLTGLARKKTRSRTLERLHAECKRLASRRGAVSALKYELKRLERNPKKFDMAATIKNTWS